MRKYVINQAQACKKNREACKLFDRRYIVRTKGKEEALISYFSTSDRKINKVQCDRKGVSRKESSVAPKPIYTTCSVNTKDDWCVCCTPKPCIYTTYTLWTPEIIDVNTRDITPRQIVVDKQTKKQQKDFFKQLQRKPHKAGTLELCKFSHCRKTCTKFNLMYLELLSILVRRFEHG
jgi:hypothetical protein